ncbi:glycoside hydrolase family 15 protein [Aspergillus clavatus NRRL 1]|uniref:Glycosyl hydrolase, putative n=1 Tax=Aspergillus clavatus (strain ATCC 1007 / CBS 513.65 / DSM 816 / NCTC 3887 / NRRL 1 / QM 1276 / 107) TaxID=344612 RepID=A1C8T6_ASPCL|nr:glycosyl hydrolase, putative [Aspergillus clavatus NRRL 1]EAW13723.1 glycosyl hydrolase, putative [Aspergillus clavatus NRRL 1]
MATHAPYCSIEDYGIIGDMHTCALVSKNGSLDFMCWPVFDSPSVFCRLLDNSQGGYFSISPVPEIQPISKQRYRPYTNVLETRWIDEDGVVSILDYLPVGGKRPSQRNAFASWCACGLPGAQDKNGAGCRSGVIRKIECLRGQMDMNVEVFPAFNYARDAHTGRWVAQDGDASQQEYLFESQTQSLQLRVHTNSSSSHEASDATPAVQFDLQEKQGPNGPGLFARVRMIEGQSVALILHHPDTTLPHHSFLHSYLDKLERSTLDFWASWIGHCSFRGHYREQVERSLLVLKLLTYKPTGAIVAAPTFSLPEHIGGSRNWDYRYSWVRDAAFVVYVFLKNGYPEEAEDYINFIFDRVFPPVTDNRADHNAPLLPLMVTIRGEHDMPELELNHLEGYKGSQPVRIGNAAASHTQLDIYGELMDSVYLYNKHGRPISYDQWLAVRRLIAHVIRVRRDADRSIWEVRGTPQNFVYSKIMLWVALDRALRLADKRSNLPCPDRTEWMHARDELYDEIMSRGYNPVGRYFCMSYENQETLDAAVLIAPLVFFVAPNDPRFLHTLQRIMLPPAKGGLSVANMVSRYDHRKVDDGVGGVEGAFVMVTFWLVEAMMRASKAMPYHTNDPFYGQLRKMAVTHFDNMLSFANHLGMFSEEVSISGEQIGNTPQAFSHLAYVSAAMNLGEQAKW